MGRRSRAHSVIASRRTKRVALGTIRSDGFIMILTIYRRLSLMGMGSLERVKQDLAPNRSSQTRAPSSIRS